MYFSSGTWTMSTLIRFAFASGIGLIVDLLAFRGMLSLTNSILVTNLTSSILGFSLVYLTVTRYTFRTIRNLKNYSIFFFWYLASIFLYSELISVLLNSFPGLSAIEGKLITVPLSFGLNFLFNLLLFSTGKRVSH